MRGVMQKALLFLTTAALFPIGVLAAEHEQQHHVPSISDTFPFWINFILYVALLYFLLRKTMATALANRREGIGRALKAGETERLQAEARLSEAQTKMRTVDQKITSLIQEIEQETLRETKRLIEEAEVKAKRIEQQGRELATAEERAVQTRIQREVIEQVLARTVQRVAAENNVEKDKILRESALAGLRNMTHG